jgi:chromate reductase, NAD(P)H dehydrogenase (quinone)
VTYTAIAISGSLRRNSSNTGLLHLAKRLAPPELQLEIVDIIADLPYYNADLEETPPAVVTQWRELVIGADALVIALPEYNYGPSAVAKNAIDWLTRPLGQHALRGKVIALLTSAGKGGGVKVQDAVGPILGLLGNTIVEEPPVQIALGATLIGADGSTEDPDIAAVVTQKMANVVNALASR